VSLLTVPSDPLPPPLPKLDVETVGLSEDLPVQILEVVALHILTILSELDREPMIRAPVHTRDKAFDNEPGLEIHSRQTADDRWIEEFADRSLILFPG
jgi:hypothetical protein